MKTFKNSADAMRWAYQIANKTTEEFKKEIAEDIYADSKEFTYIDTQTMYDIGADLSKFDEGTIVLAGPQLPELYYNRKVKPGPGNLGAVPMWFEATKIKNLSKYIKKYRFILKEIKRS